MDEFVQMLTERAGIDQATAEKVINAVVGFIKEHPEKLTSLLGDSPLGDLGDIGGSLGKLFGR